MLALLPAPPATPGRSRLGRARTTTSPCRSPNARSVLGNFDDATVQHAGVTSTFFEARREVLRQHRRPGRQARRLSRSRYTFGVAPLQQYLDRISRAAVCRRSAIAWDTRPQSPGRAALVPPLPERDASPTTTRCTGRGRSRTGTSCVPSATRPTCKQELRCDQHTLQDHLVARSTSPARPAMGRGHGM